MRKFSLAAMALALIFAALSSRAADTLPAQLTDAAFWKMVSDYSEPDGPYPFEVITSNELQYQNVLPQLAKSPGTGGVYLGVGPEQNFTYIAALRPKVAFIIDIRRDMMLEHLMYKAVFEMSSDRVDFVSNLFSRRRPASLTGESAVDGIFRAFASVPGDPEFAEANLKAILSRLRTTHGFAINDADERRIRALYMAFLREGVVTFRASLESPGYTRLMTVTDASGRNWSFLASRENYDIVRTMQQKNLVVPVVGDFAGPKALRMIGQYLKEHAAVVSVFYLSNVEDYLQGPLLTAVRPATDVWSAYKNNIASLPVDGTSVFIRTSLASGFEPWLASMAEFVRTGVLI